MWEIVEVVKVLDDMGGASSADLGRDISLLVGDPVYRQSWFDLLMYV